MAAYYNENEPYAAEWLRNLIKAGHIASGDVDERSIVEVEAKDLKRYAQCHFFAGIGVWSYALRQAGWADDRKVWTGSCPCQPFSVAGLGKGFADERHLWPVWAKLIEECRPDVIFGEQVANSDALTWLDVVQADLEAASYAVGTVDLCAAGVGAPHLRQRLWWVAESARQRRTGERVCVRTGRPLKTSLEAAGGSTTSRLADAEIGRQTQGGPPRSESAHQGDGLEYGRVVGDADSSGPQIRPRQTNGRRAVRIEGAATASPGVVGGFWEAADLIWCQDGKYRPVEPGTFPLAHGITNRVGRLRAIGNALVAPVAEAFVRAFIDC